MSYFQQKITRDAKKQESMAHTLGKKAININGSCRSTDIELPRSTLQISYFQYIHRAKDTVNRMEKEKLQTRRNIFKFHIQQKI